MPQGVGSFDRLITSTPVNGTAGRVTSGGIHYEPDIKHEATLARHDAPPKTLPPPPNCQDLTGRQVGRFTVVGYLGSGGGKGGRHGKSRWLVRCRCGAYEDRRSPSIRNPANDVDACVECRHLIQLKRNEIWRRTGKDVPVRDLM